MIVTCALAISLGTYLGGWRVIRTLGKGLVEIESPQGMAAESLLRRDHPAVGHFGYSLSTTHVATGSILGTGLGKKGAEVRWNVAGPDGYRVAAHPALLPGSSGAAAYRTRPRHRRQRGRDRRSWLILVAVSAVIYARSRASKVNHTNVNDEWTGVVTPAEPRANSGGLRRQGKHTMSLINLSAMWKIVVFGLLAGAGLPAIFAVGLRSRMSRGPKTRTAGADPKHVVGGSLAGMIIAADVFPDHPGRHRLGHLRGLPDRSSRPC